MNGDHVEDNLLIARAFGYPEASGSTMTGLDGTSGVWSVIDPQGTHELRVDWPAGIITERPQIRREVVMLYRAACKKLGITPREEHQEPQHLQSDGAQDHPRAAHGSPRATGNPHAAAHPHAAGHPHAGGNP
ncbi:MAG: DUF2470 domain-containing protein, partial [Actinobacteria bacterium]|nr:DUF2470 domain-containing protein [Actinomycetota bacterium]